jgi:nucleotide-binding universal stress UspA family protein
MDANLYDIRGKMKTFKFKKFVLATDFSQFSNHALLFAQRLANIYSAELYILHVITTFNQKYRKALTKSDLKEFKRSATDEIKNVIKNLDLDSERTFAKVVLAVSAEEGILNFIKSNKIDLLVMGTYGRGWSGPYYIGSVTERVTRHATCPVLTVSSRSNEDIGNILVPIDFSENSKNALSIAKNIANKYDARISLLHIIEASHYPSFYGIKDFNFKKMSERIKQKSPNLLNKMLKDLPGSDVEADTYVFVGQPAHQIVKFIHDYEPDLAVISSHGLSSIEYFLLGSVAEKVIKRATCPVLSIR